MKKFLLLLAFTVCSASLFAQSEKDKKAYDDEAVSLQKQIWDDPIAEFKSTNVPANLAKESAVILARSFSLSRASTSKFKFGHHSLTTRTTKFSIFHERVKISDKTALESFSTLEYQKILNKTTSELFAKFMDVNNTYVGAKVIKATGKEIVVNTSEEVLTKDESKDKQGKLAIPDLQVGDILDYYIAREYVADKEEGNSYKENDNIIYLVDEYPVMYFSVDFKFNKKIKTRIIYANNAKHFDQTSNEDGDQLLNLKLTNVPKFKDQLWISALRQYPYIEIGSSYDDPVDKLIEQNHFDKNPMFQAKKLNFEQEFNELQFPFSEQVDNVKNYYKTSKVLKATPPDSIAKTLYALWKFNTFCHYVGSDASTPADMKYRVANGKLNVVNISLALNELKVDFDVILVASRYSNSLENVFNYEDFGAMIRINGTKPEYMYFGDMATQFNEIPERYQGENVIVLHPKRKNRTEYSFTETNETLPVISSEQNHVDEQIDVNLSAQDMQKLKVDRHVKEMGALRDDQLSLLTLLDMDAVLQQAAKGDELSKRFKNYIGAKKIITTIQAQLDKEKGDQDKYFKDEIKSKYDQEPKEVSNCKIINTGVDVSSPVFEFTEGFALDNLVKKAGNNYIIDAGKLTGGFLKLDEKDKTRDVDVYMPCARSFKYVIVINIPQGYTAKGMEEMTQNKSNKTGSFTSSAVLNGNKLTITATRAYTHNFEKAADWSSLVDLISTASDFDSKKILIEKVN